MCPPNAIRLIPRNNWDYGFRDFLWAFPRSFQKDDQAPNLARLFNSQPVVTVSGRASLYAVLTSLALPPGSSVGVPLFCCPVVFNAISQAGLRPLFIDCNPYDYNLSIGDFAKKRHELTAVVTVHMFGNPCDMDAINTIAAGMPVIEDCAQSIYSQYKGRPTGSLSTAAFFSFRCGKYISAGEGSAIFCRDAELRGKIQRLVTTWDSCSLLSSLFHCITTFAKATLYQRPWYGLIGYPVGKRLDKKLNLTAKDGFATGKIASADLALADRRIGTFRKNIDHQRRHADMLRKIIHVKNVVLPSENNGNQSNWYQFALRFENAQRRDAMSAHLWRRGIDAAKYLDTVVDEAEGAYGYKRGSCPNSELCSKTVLLIPIHYTLRERDIRRIGESINEFQN